MTETLFWQNARILPNVSDRLQRSQSQLLCPITGHACEGDLSHLCEDYGCARKGGLSPNSDENL